MNKYNLTENVWINPTSLKTHPPRSSSTDVEARGVFGPISSAFIWNLKVLVPFQVFYVKSERIWSHFKCFCAILQFWKKDKNEMNEQPTQSTPIYIWWKSNPNWDIKEAAQQTVCRDQECYRCLGAIGDCPELNI